MAKRKTTQRVSDGDAPAAPRRRSRRSAASPIKGMVVGALVFVAVAAFFMLRVDGATPFERLRRALGDPQKAAAPATRSARPAPPAKPEGPSIARNAQEAAPMEQLSDDEQRGLDKLIEQRAR